MKSPLNYMGGKSRLTDTLCPIINDTPHTCYCEPFCGAAWVLLGKDPGVSKSEVINDADGELIAFWRVIQRHYLAFLDLYRNAVISRQIYDWQKMTRPETLTDLERAVRYYCLQRLAFDGKVEGRNFGTSTTSAPRLDVLSIQSNLTEIHQRIARVTIEHLDGTDCIRRYDRPHTLFFVDPPYYHTAGYAVAFPDERYTELARLLESIKGKFLLTINAVDEMRDVFRSFTIKEIGTSYSLAKAGSRSDRVTELFIRNF